MKFNLHKASLVLFGILCLTSCKVYDESLLRIPAEPLETKLPALKVTYGNFNSSVTYGDPCKCELNIMSDEVEFNLTEYYGTHYGYFSFQIQTVDYGSGDGFLLPSIFSLSILNLFGMPSRSYMKEVVVKISILDSNRKLLKKYTSRGKSRVPVAYYYGYRDKYASMLIHSNTLKIALSEVRKDINSDAKELREKLLSAGPLIDN